MSRIDEIRKRLGGATHGEWRYSREPAQTAIYCGQTHIGSFKGIANRALVAHAPADLEYLLGLVKQQAERIKTLEELAVATVLYLERLGERCDGADGCGCIISTARRLLEGESR